MLLEVDRRYIARLPLMAAAFCGSAVMLIVRLLAAYIELLAIWLWKAIIVVVCKLLPLRDIIYRFIAVFYNYQRYLYDELLRYYKILFMFFNVIYMAAIFCDTIFTNRNILRNYYRIS